MLLAVMTALFMAIGYAIGGNTGMLIALVAAAAMNMFSYWNADKMVLKMHHAVEVTEQSAPEYYGIVRQLAQRAELPMPKVYLIKNQQPNAFATGRNPENAAVAATTGLLERLSHEEVAGVMAHELAHVKHRDTLTMTITATLAGAISMLANFAFFFRGGRRDGAGIIGTLAAMILAPLAAMIVQMAISRTREYSAGLRMDGLFSTHPPTEKRIEALRAMEAGIGQNNRPAASVRDRDARSHDNTPWGRNPGKRNQKGPWS